MLLRFRVENHRSLRDEQELSFVASSLSEGTASLIPVGQGDTKALPVLAIYGPNASGKSSVLHAFQFMCDAIQRSQRNWNPARGVPREPFLLDAESASRSSLYQADFVLEGTRYEYGFVTSADRILEEWLYAYPNGRRQEWFVREVGAKNEFKFSREFSGENKAIQKLTRPNSLFLSAAAQNNHELLSPIFQWFERGVAFVTGQNREEIWHVTARMFDQPQYKEAILGLLRMADLGVCGVEIRREEVTDAVKRMIEAAWPADTDIGRQLRSPDMRLPRVSMRHSTAAGTDTALPADRESDGTRALFGLAGPIVRSLATGGLVCIDEVDASLHPLLVLELVKLFQQPDKNIQHAQLLFTTHDTNILDSDVIRRDQIWFTEKDRSGATHLYPLTDFRPRKAENFERGYLQGRFGAIPFLAGAERLVEALNGDGASE